MGQPPSRSSAVVNRPTAPSMSVSLSRPNRPMRKLDTSPALLTISGTPAATCSPWPAEPGSSAHLRIVGEAPPPRWARRTPRPPPTPTPLSRQHARAPPCPAPTAPQRSRSEPGRRGLEHRAPQRPHRVRGHGGVVGRVPAVQVGLHDRQPPAQVRGEAGRLVVASTASRAAASHHHQCPRTAAPIQPFCGAVISTSTPSACMSTHDAAGGHAVEHEQAADLVHRLGQRAHVVVGQHDPRCGLDVRPRTATAGRSAGCRDDLARSAVAPRRELGVRASTGGAPSARLTRRGISPWLEDLRPAVGEEAVADHHHPFAGRELSGDRLHGVGAAARNDERPFGARTSGGAPRWTSRITPWNRCAHVVERTVGEDDGVLEQAAWVTSWWGSSIRTTLSGLGTFAEGPDDDRRLRRQPKSMCVVPVVCSWVDACRSPCSLRRRARWTRSLRR